ncbi:Na+/H+ antiporter [Taibaiella helva]|uniref:Na+/H+ antiporter n=1 Tax=Taibaiella helva TaxID=2301235 RepID=UPI000E573FF7|nr:Na+/H+ antiporter [Taibaiella helva]
MVEKFIPYVIIVIVILLLVMLSQKLKVAYPVVLVLGGLAISFIPGLPLIQIDPELIFIIFLPPLLYEAAWYTSWKELWKWRRVISSFAFIIVLITSLVVALVAHSCIPGFTLALGFLLGGIVSPPDAVSATSILKQVKVPKRVTSILEGESLLNDASSLVVFRFALIAVSTGSFVFHEAATSFVVVIVMGIATGLVVGLIYYALHRWLPTDANIDIVLTLTAPYVMYIVAEQFHFSGVLAVVTGGLFLSARSHQILSHRSRLRGATVWSALSFVLNGLVFILIGLELPVIVAGLGNVSLGAAIGYGVLITVALVISRILCTLGASVFTVFISRYITTADNRPGWRGPIIIGWAGMRGVVSLAAALSVPFYLANGSAFPQRNLILFITFMVILLTLVVQGLTLPLVIRKVNMEDPDKHLSPELQEVQVKRLLAEKSIAFMKEYGSPIFKEHEALRYMMAKYESEQHLPDEEDPMAHIAFRDAYLELLNRQRSWLMELNHHEDMDDEVIRKYLWLVDLEEEKHRVRYEHE